MDDGLRVTTSIEGNQTQDRNGRSRLVAEAGMCAGTWLIYMNAGVDSNFSQRMYGIDSVHCLRSGTSSRKVMIDNRMESLFVIIPLLRDRYALALKLLDPRSPLGDSSSGGHTSV